MNTALGFARRNVVQIAGMATMVAVVAVVGGVASCGSGPSTAAVVVATPAASATPDASVADVKAATQTFVATWLQSGVSGDGTAINALVEPGSHAESNVAALLDVSHETHKTFVPTSTTFTGWSITPLEDQATADVDLTLTGYDASWPDLRSLGASKALPVKHLHLIYQRSANRWIAADFSY